MWLNSTTQTSKLDPYNKEKFFTNIKNYGLSLFELKDFITMCLINQHGFNNIIYLSLTNSSKSDPYSFYILDNVSLDISRGDKVLIQGASGSGKSTLINIILGRSAF